MSTLNIVHISSKYQERIINFDCSDESDVEKFLKTDALKFHENNLVRTHLLLSEDKLIGYFSLFADHVTVPRSKRESRDWKIGSVLKKQMYPSVRLHYMGIDKRYRKRGYGKLLLYAALDVCQEFSENIGCVFVNLEALNKTNGFYENYAFRQLERPHNNITKMILKIDEFDLDTEE